MRDIEFDTCKGSSGYACIRSDEQRRIRDSLDRDWKRHPELRAEYNNNYDKYIRSNLHNVTFG